MVPSVVLMCLPHDPDIVEDLEMLLTVYRRSLEAAVARKSSWIFQANPKYYDIDQAVINLERITWSVATHTALCLDPFNQFRPLTAEPKMFSSH